MIGPPAVRRGLLRVTAGTAGAMVLTALAAVPLARSTLGWTADDTRARVHDDIRSRVASLGAALDAAAVGLTRDAAQVEAGATGSADAVRALFDRVGALHTSVSQVTAVTIYDADGVPLAWEGRPATLPASRLAGGSATFLVPTPLGLRLARLEPIAGSEASRRRAGVVVAEAALSTAAGPSQSVSAVEVQTPLAPVLLGPSAGASSDPAAVELAAPDGTILGTARVAPADIDEARARWWGRVAAVLWLIVTIGLTLATGPLADWRALSRTLTTYLAVTTLAAVMLIAAWVCVDWSLDSARLAEHDEVRFLATTLLAAALVWLAWTTVARWRLARRAGRSGAGAAPWRYVLHALVGVALGAAVAHYDVLVAHALPVPAFEGDHFALTPLAPGRLATAVGAVVLHAAAAGAVLVVVAAAALLWPVGGGARGRRWRLVALTAGTVAGAVFWHPPGATGGPIAVALAALLAMAAAADWARAVLRRGTQPARLLVLFAALALPSLALYPALAGLAARDRHATIEGDLATQIVNQRRDLQLYLREALVQIDRMEGMSDLVAASVPAASGPIAVDAAFHVWSQTSLATRRLTSSIELYDTAGRMVNRFALNLPETSADQAWQESSCRWELFEEVSPFFAEERRLLHAGRAVCVEDGRGGTRTVGSVVVHVVLDYSNLPFLAAQNPYVELLRANAGAPDAPARRRGGVRGLRLEPPAVVRLGRRRLAALGCCLRQAHHGARAVLDGDRRSRRGLGRLPAERPRRDLRGGPSAGVAPRTPVGAGRSGRAGRPRLCGAAGRADRGGVAGRPRAGVGPGPAAPGAGQLLSHAVPRLRRRRGRAGGRAGHRHPRLHGDVAAR